MIAMAWYWWTLLSLLAWFVIPAALNLGGRDATTRSEDSDGL